MHDIKLINHTDFRELITDNHLHSIKRRKSVSVSVYPRLANVKR